MAPLIEAGAHDASHAPIGTVVVPRESRSSHSRLPRPRFARFPGGLPRPG